jgi:hypothetical protein
MGYGVTAELNLGARVQLELGSWTYRALETNFFIMTYLSELPNV